MKKMTNIKKFLEKNNIEYTLKLVYSNLEEVTFYIDGLKFEISNPMEKSFYEVTLYKRDFNAIDGYILDISYSRNTQKEVNDILKIIIEEMKKIK